MTKEKTIKFNPKPLDLGYEICDYCGREIKKGELHCPKLEWGERQCEIIKDYQEPILRVNK